MRLSVHGPGLDVAFGVLAPGPCAENSPQAASRRVPCCCRVDGLAGQACVQPVHAHAPAGPGARLDPVPTASPFGRGGRCCLRWLGVGFGRGNARQPSRATETARPAPGQQPNCGCYWHWHFAMSVLGYLLFIGRVYKHDAYIYEMRTGTRQRGPVCLKTYRMQREREPDERDLVPTKVTQDPCGERIGSR